MLNSRAQSQYIALFGMLMSQSGRIQMKILETTNILERSNNLPKIEMDTLTNSELASIVGGDGINLGTTPPTVTPQSAALLTALGAGGNPLTTIAAAGSTTVTSQQVLANSFLMLKNLGYLLPTSPSKP
jgi:bacteriocin-like protein